MQFKSYKGRRVGLREANKDEIAEFKRQLKNYHNVRNTFNIDSCPDTTYIVIDNEYGREIGLIKVDEENKNNVLHVQISIPNEAWRARYGTEAIHKFVNCCKEKNLYKKMYLEENNSIVQAYKRERPDEFTSSSLELN